MRLKPLAEQVIVITGASSGIGLETARQAVAAGASVVLASRGIAALNDIVKELNSRGLGEAVAVECDVKEAAQVEALAASALEHFGGIDTWINNAGVSIFGRLTEVPLEEKRDLFETNFWGTVYGCRSAVRAMRDEGGALINIGSVVSDRAVPLQGMYAASKHAVKAYTEGLRMELEAAGVPLSVTLIKPAAIDTPYLEHGVNHMDHHPTHVGPVYSPSLVAAAILKAAVHGGRDIYVGGVAPMFAFMEHWFPRLGDFMMEKFMMENAQSDPALDEGIMKPNLRHAPTDEGAVRGPYPGHVTSLSPADSARLHPVAAGAVAVGLGLATAAGISALLGSSRMRTAIAGLGASAAGLGLGPRRGTAVGARVGSAVGARVGSAGVARRRRESTSAGGRATATSDSDSASTSSATESATSAPNSTTNLH